ncbi:MAG: signal peptidase I [Myxococcales bacterium]|nr:signal peptidase I [Myxococcales bacterium]
MSRRGSAARERERARMARGSASGTRSVPAEGAARPDAPSERARPSRWERTRANLKTLAGAVALAAFIRIVLFEPFEIDGPSMEPSLLHGDRVIVAKYAFGLLLPFQDEALVTWGTPSLGDVVIVHSPMDGEDIVKRVVGLPGDVIEVRGETLYRNDRPVPREELGACDPSEQHVETARGPTTPCVVYRETLEGRAHRTSQWRFARPIDFGPELVPRDHVFVLGDHRDASNDSRRFGPVPISRIKGRALAIYWSNSSSGFRWRRIGMAVP